MTTWDQKRGTSFDYTNDGLILDGKFYHIPASAFYQESYD